MGSRDSVQKGLVEENPGDDSKDRVSETVIAISPESLPNWGSSTSTSNGSGEDLNHSGEEIASNVVHPPMEHQIGIQLGRPEGAGASDLNLASAIDVRCADGEDCDSVERICRICHLESDLREPEVGPKTRVDVIDLGCGCKGELGCAHSSCAATWFSQKGNRLCEICGKTAENVAGTTLDHRFMEQWNENRLSGEEAIPLERGARCWEGQPCCNLLLACLVMAFVIPWLLRIDMF